MDLNMRYLKCLTNGFVVCSLFYVCLFLVNQFPFQVLFVKYIYLI